jgi:hypothetical protein
MPSRHTLPALLAGLSLALGACATAPTAPKTVEQVVEAPAEAAPAPELPGFEEPIAPLSAPVALAYKPARFQGRSAMRVRHGDSPASSLSVAFTGELVSVAPERVQATLVTESVAVDGERSDNAVALLVQDIALGRTGELLGMSSRTPASTGPVPDRYRVLEQGWRDRLPRLSPRPVGPGDAIEAEDRLLAPLRVLLGGRDAQLRTTRPIRTVVVGLAQCGEATCLVGRREGAARLTGQRGAIDVEVSGHALLDPVTGLFVRERELIRLTAADGEGAGRQLEIEVETDLTQR